MQEMPIGPAIADNAVDVLSDVLSWEVSADAWDGIVELLASMHAAVLAGDEDATRDAVFDLEDASAYRPAALGTEPLLPAPPRVRELANRLIHTLDGRPPIEHPLPAQLDAAPVSAMSPLSALSADGHIEAQELVVHLLAPLDGPNADDAYRQIRVLWTACMDRFGPVVPVPGGPTSLELPKDLATLPATPLIAAMKNADTAFQSVVRREHDLLTLSLGFTEVPTAAGESSWDALERTWDSVAADRTGALLGEARLFLGKTAADELPLAGTTAIDGFSVWEADPHDDGRVRRRIAVIAASDRDAELSAWTWSRGDFATPPFARYLMHMAKIRYQLRVRENAEPVSQLCSRVEDSAARALERLRSDELLVAEVASRRRDMSRTVSIAMENMAAVVDPESHAEAPPNDLFRDDAEVGRWLVRQLEADGGYLTEAAARAARALASTRPNERSSAASRAPSAASPHDAPDLPTFGFITALPEEFDAVRMLMADPVRWPVRGDRADYVVGTMPSLLTGEPHRVVLTMLGDTANADASSACAHLVRSFDTVDQVVMVGIAAGIPAPEAPARHVRVGDIVVGSWGLVDYDHVVETLDGPELRQPFPRPSSLLATRAKMLEAGELMGERPWEEWIDLAVRTPGFERPSAEDVLYSADDPTVRIPHPDPALSGHRPERPKVHYGRIGSADRSMRNGAIRDALAHRYQLRALEMEGQGVGSASFAAGVEWFMVRGVSDYGDSHMANGWRNYASVVAAAYVRALLAECPPIAPRGGHARVAGS